MRLDAMFTRYVMAGQVTTVTNEPGRPQAVLTIDYGEPPMGFVVGRHYVLQALRIHGTKIDYGFCPLEKENQ